MPEKDHKECNICATQVRLDALEKKVEADHKEFYNRIGALERSSAVTAERYDTIVEKIDGIAESVEILTAAPGKRWNGVVDKAVFAIIGAVMTYILTNIGL